MSPHAVIPVVALVCCAVPLGAQEIRPVGTFDYDVEATWEGDPIAPWDAQTLVRDTTIDGRLAWAFTSNQRRGDSGWRFVATTVVERDPLVSPRARWDGNGYRGTAWCEARVESGRIHITDGHGEQSSERYEGALVPSFTVPWIVSSMALEEGDTIRLRPYFCDSNPAGPATIRVWDMAGIVSSGTHQHEDGATEAAWVIRARDGYETEIVIAKSDRKVLRVTTYPGTSGTMVETLASD